MGRPRREPAAPPRQPEAPAPIPRPAAGEPRPAGGGTGTGAGAPSPSYNLPARLQGRRVLFVGVLLALGLNLGSLLFSLTRGDAGVLDRPEAMLAAVTVVSGLVLLALMEYGRRSGGRSHR